MEFLKMIILENGRLPQWLYDFKPFIFIIIGFITVLNIEVYIGGVLLMVVGADILYVRNKGKR